MQLFVLLAALVAVNVGIVYVGSEIYEEGQKEPQQGIVEIEEVAVEPSQEPTSEPAPDTAPQ